MSARIGDHPRADHARSDHARPGWSGRWVADRLDAHLITDPGPGGGLELTDLVGMALRVNPRRAHLLVSTVLGKHVPTDPRLVYGSGLLLGAMVADQLRGYGTGIAGVGSWLLRSALSGDRSASSDLIAACTKLRRYTQGDAVVLGYAETATGLGHAVADMLEARYLHSTRRPVPGLTPVGGFEEEHSHVTGHLLLPADAAFLAGIGPLVLVDDEMSTGQTVLNTIAELHALYPRPRYVVASLVDLRSPADRDRLEQAANRLGVSIEVVALAAGTVELPADVLARGQSLVAQHAKTAPTLPVPAGDTAGVLCEPVATCWPAGVPDGGRHGFLQEHRDRFDTGVRDAAMRLYDCLPAGPRRVLVLGSEELMYLPVRVAADLVEIAEHDSHDSSRLEVLFSSTTRSPVLAVDEDGYAIRTAVSFTSHDSPADGPGRRYAYNVAPAAGQRGFDDIVLVVDDHSTRWPIGPDGQLLRELAALAPAVHLLVVPSYRPAGASPPCPAAPAGPAGIV